MQAHHTDADQYKGAGYVPLKISGHRVWCPFCKRCAQLLKIPDAAKLINVNRRTIYRYIEQGAVYAVKTAGKRFKYATLAC